MGVLCFFDVDNRTFKCLYSTLNMCWVCIIHQELEDIEVRLRHGGLGGVPDFQRWTKKLAAAATVQDFVSTWRQFQLHANIVECGYETV